MPSCITHQLIASEAAEGFPAWLRAATEEHPDYFFLGAQGPDSFFFLKPLSKKEFNLGRFLHRERVFEAFGFFRNYLSALTDEAEKRRAAAFVAGYVCHYAADTAFHPFVYRYLETHGDRGMAHQLIESDWDVYFARRVCGREAERWRFPLSASKINREETLYRLFAALSEFLGRRPLKRSSFARGVRNFARYLRFFHGKSHQKGLARMEKLFHAKPALSCLYPRKQPNDDFLCGDEFCELSGGRGNSADELFALAVSESIRLCGIFFSEAPLSESDFNKSFLTAAPL